MALSKEKKEAKVAELRKWFEMAPLVIVVNYQNLKVSDADNFRRALREHGAALRAGKNTLFAIAARGTPSEVLARHFVGQKALVFGQGDPVAISKVVVNFAKERAEFLKIHGAVLNGSLVDAEGVTALSQLPSRDVLLAKLLSVLVATPRNLVGVLSGIPRSFLYALKSLEQQKSL